MFAIKSRMAFAIRALLIAVIFFNALMINPAPVQAEQEIVSTKVGQLETRSIPTFPTFERPEERTTGQDEHPSDAPVFSRYQMIAPDDLQPEHPADAPMFAPQQQQSGSCSANEGLCLAADYFSTSDVTADWIVQRKTGESWWTTKETLLTFYSGTIPRGQTVLQNFVGSLKYIVKPADAGVDIPVAFNLAGIQTGGYEAASGSQSIKYYVDIVSPSGLPVTCDRRTGANYGTAFCVQDSASHVHGMATSGPVLTYLGNFNDGGNFANFAVHGLTAGQELIVTFGSTSNVTDLNTLSGCPRDCVSPSPSTQGSAGEPINTRTGNYEYFTEDISIPTSAGDLSREFDKI